MDANCSYWKVEIEEDDRDESAFRSHYRKQSLSCMPFGLCDAPSTFQLTVYVILLPVKWQFAFEYLYDTSVFLRTVNRYIEHCGTILLLLPKQASRWSWRNAISSQKGSAFFGQIIHPLWWTLLLTLTTQYATQHRLEQLWILKSFWG